MAKFKNLEAEMIRYELKIEDIAEELEIVPNTMRRKLSGEIGITIEEAKKIQKFLKKNGAEFTIDFLFAE